jgi:hypothetical protein
MRRVAPLQPARQARLAPPLTHFSSPSTRKASRVTLFSSPATLEASRVTEEVSAPTLFLHGGNQESVGGDAFFVIAGT